MMQSKFINPYNFVKNSYAPSRSPQAPAVGTLTGYVDAHFTVKTPLCIPGDFTKDRKEHKSYEFFNLNGEPVVPGSELRGMFRSVFETLNSSCYSVLTSNLLSKRQSKAFAPGVLQQVDDNNSKKWVLYKAEMKKTNTPQGDNSVKREWYDAKGNKKTFYFTYNRSARPFTVSQKVVDDYLKILELYKEFNPGRARFFNAVEPSPDKCIPLFYSESRGVITKLTPAQMSRVTYEKTVEDLLGEFVPCNGKILCPACNLFGNVDSLSPAASRVRFTDATAYGYEISKPVLLKELASPKITSIEFYSLNKDKQLVNLMEWNYDDIGTTLRGRKFYFHNQNAVSDPLTYTDTEETKRNAHVRLVKPSDKTDAKFSFRVYFDSITETELQLLLLSLNFGENGGTLMHKLGHGKPLGLGSIKVAVDGVKVRSIDRDGYRVECYSEICFDYAEELNPIRLAAKVQSRLIASSPETVSQLLFFADFESIGKDKLITYPLDDDGKGKSNSRAGHKWFSWNRKKACSTGWHSILPVVTDNADDLELDYLPSINEGSSDNSDGKTKPASSEKSTQNDQDNMVICTKCGKSYNLGNYKGKKRQCWKCRNK